MCQLCLDQVGSAHHRFYCCWETRDARNSMQATFLTMAKQQEDNLVWTRPHGRSGEQIDMAAHS